MKFRLLLGLVALGLGLCGLSGPASADLRDFRGTWTNEDRNTRSITRIEIDPRRSGASVRVFGQCHPRDCDWGEQRAHAFARNVSADLRRDARVLIAVYDKGFAETTLIIRRADRDRLRVQGYTRFKDGGRRTNFAESHVFRRVRGPSRPAPRAERDGRRGPREDCVPFDPKRAQARNVGGRWKIVEDRHWIMDFGRNEREARQAIRVIRSYGFDRQCFVGRPDPSMTYFLARGRLPNGDMRGEDCVRFDPRRTEVRRVRGSWKIVDGNHWIMDFGPKEREAREAYDVFRRYGATHRCFVGRPGPSMTYLRR